MIEETDPRLEEAKRELQNARIFRDRADALVRQAEGCERDAADLEAAVAHDAEAAHRAAVEPEKPQDERQQAYWVKPTCGTCAENPQATERPDCVKLCGPSFRYHPASCIRPAPASHAEVVLDQVKAKLADLARLSHAPLWLNCLELINKIITDAEAVERPLSCGDCEANEGSTCPIAERKPPFTEPKARRSLYALYGQDLNV